MSKGKNNAVCKHGRRKEHGCRDCHREPSAKRKAQTLVNNAKKKFRIANGDAKLIASQRVSYAKDKLRRAKKRHLREALKAWKKKAEREKKKAERAKKKAEKVRRRSKPNVRRRKLNVRRRSKPNVRRRKLNVRRRSKPNVRRRKLNVRRRSKPDVRRCEPNVRRENYSVTLITTQLAQLQPFLRCIKLLDLAGTLFGTPIFAHSATLRSRKIMLS